jgi:hypothetical protein
LDYSNNTGTGVFNIKPALVRYQGKSEEIFPHLHHVLTYVMNLLIIIIFFQYKSYEIFETTTENGVNSELLLRTTQRTDGTIYKCDAENEHGRDERTIKLVVVGIDY